MLDERKKSAENMSDDMADIDEQFNSMRIAINVNSYTMSRATSTGARFDHINEIIATRQDETMQYDISSRHISYERKTQTKHQKPRPLYIQSM